MDILSELTAICPSQESREWVFPHVSAGLRHCFPGSELMRRPEVTKQMNYFLEIRALWTYLSRGWCGEENL